MFDNNKKIIVVLALPVALLVGLLWSGFTDVAESEEVQRGGPWANVIVIAQAGNDQGAFPSGAQTSQYSRVGRLAVQLIQNGGIQEVPFDSSFHTNDEFRFNVTTNRDGWLYILHKSPGGNLKLLYPPTDPNTGQLIGNSHVEKNKNYLIPQSTEGSFIFDTDTGAETFFLVIKDRQEPPSLNDIMVSNEQGTFQQQNVAVSQAQQNQSLAANYGNQYPSQQQTMPGFQEQSQNQAPTTYGNQYPSQQQNAPVAPVRQQFQRLATGYLNYSIIPKGVNKLTSMRYRGVSFKPALQGTDPGTYFAPQPDSELQDAWFAFKLNHVD